MSQRTHVITLSIWQLAYDRAGWNWFPKKALNVMQSLNSIFCCVMSCLLFIKHQLFQLSNLFPTNSQHLHKLEMVGNSTIACPCTSRLPFTLDNQSTTAYMTSSFFFIFPSLILLPSRAVCTNRLLQPEAQLRSFMQCLPALTQLWDEASRYRVNLSTQVKVQSYTRMQCDCGFSQVCQASLMTWKHYVSDSLSSHAGVANKSKFFQCCLSSCANIDKLFSICAVMNVHVPKHLSVQYSQDTHDGHFLCCSRLPKYTIFYFYLKMFR